MPPPSAAKLAVGTWNIGQGASSKLRRVLEWCIDSALDVVGLQEIGDVELDPALVGAAGFRAYSCPSQHSGVAILIRKQLCQFIRNVERREQDGRVISVQLDFNGSIILLINCYLPSGIDFTSGSISSSPASSSSSSSSMSSDTGTNSNSTLARAQSVYESVLNQCRDVNVPTIVMGDMNETITALDRSRNTTNTKHNRLIQQMEVNGFRDVYRQLHPHQTGFTHSAVSPSLSILVHSRLDYFFTRALSLHQVDECEVQLNAPSLSHHHPLTMQIGLPHLRINQPRPEQVKYPIPNIRSASEKKKHKLVEVVEAEWSSRLDWVEEQLRSGTRNGIDAVTEQLSSSVYVAASKIFGMTGQSKWKHKALTLLKQQKKSLISLRVLAQQIQQSNRNEFELSLWKSKLRRCRKLVRDTGAIPDPSSVSFFTFISDTSSLLNTVSRNINRVKLQLEAQRKSDVNTNPTAAVHRMMRVNEHHQVDNVVTTDGRLVTGPQQIKSFLHQNFASVFNLNLPLPLSAADAADAQLVSSASAIEKARMAATPPPSNPDWYHRIYTKRRSEIKAEWYRGLMRQVTPEEVRITCSTCPYFVAPGHDGVNVGVWRILSERSELMCSIIAILFTCCLAIGVIPALGKKSIIVPIAKKASQPMTMSNIRPISLQSALTKLLSKLLATRLANILASHPILHPAQEAFIKNGAISNCVDSWLDIWESSKEKKKDCFTLFYDIKAAYDSVQHMDLLRSLHRLHLPPSFIHLIADSLTGLTSAVRTIYGLTDEFAVLRSVRQGDPLAPLLYVILMDALHAGMECNPLSEHRDKRDGMIAVPAVGIRRECEGIRSTSATAVASKGFADDTVAMSGTLAGLSRINDWVHAWTLFNHMQLHPDKTQLVGRCDGKAMSNAPAVGSQRIAVAGKILTPASLTDHVTYLGVTTNMELEWDGMINKVNRLIGLFTSRIRAHKLDVAQAVMVVNVYLIPKLDLALRYINAASTESQMEKWDQSICSCVLSCAGSQYRIGKHALSVLTGLMLPSQYESIAKISECFLRLNNCSLSSATGQLRWQQMQSAVNARATAPARHAANNRLVRVSKLLRDVKWELNQVKESNRSIPSCDLVPHSVKHCQLRLNSKSSTLVFEHVGEWGSALPSLNVTAYTDGSYTSEEEKESGSETGSGSGSGSSKSSWGVCFVNDWFLSRYPSLPAAERDIIIANHLLAACIAGGSIHPSVSSGIFMAELQAIYRALQAVAVTWNLSIISDSQAAITAITEYQQAISERKKMRMAGRPILSLITHLIAAHRRAGSVVAFQHVKSHAAASAATPRTQHQAGNSIADRVAVFCSQSTELQQSHLAARSKGSLYFSTQQLEMQRGERFLFACQEGRLVSDDVRATLAKQCKSLAVKRWQETTSHPAYAGAEVQDLCRTLLSELDESKSKSRRRVRLALALATDSVQYYRHENKEEKRIEILQQECERCTSNAVANVKHVLSCEGRRAGREQVLDRARLCLSRVKGLSEWLRVDAAGMDLSAVICLLFSGSSVPSEVTASVRFRWMFGGFSDREFRVALNRMMAANAAVHVRVERMERDAVCAELRMLLFDHVSEALLGLFR